MEGFIGPSDPFNNWAISIGGITPCITHIVLQNGPSFLGIFGTSKFWGCSSDVEISHASFFWLRNSSRSILVPSGKRALHLKDFEIIEYSLGNCYSFPLDILAATS